MTKRKTAIAAAVLCLAAGLSGCGTLNVFPFPYQSATKAADKVLDDIVLVPPVVAVPVTAQAADPLPEPPRQ